MRLGMNTKEFREFTRRLARVRAWRSPAGILSMSGLEAGRISKESLALVAAETHWRWLGVALAGLGVGTARDAAGVALGVPGAGSLGEGRARPLPTSLGLREITCSPLNPLKSGQRGL